MRARIRRAAASDVEAMIAIKRHLMIAPGAPGLSQGGFLLGSSRERYELFIAQANVLLLESEGALLGFSITLPDPLLRASDLWRRAERIRWDEGDGGPLADPSLAAEILTGRIGYFEQLALLPLPAMRVYAPAFALAAALDLVESGHRHLFATVVSEPVANLAPLPLLRIIGARRLGCIAEEYPEVGSITSDIYHLDAGRWNFGVGPESPLYALRQRIARTLAALRSAPR